MTRNFSPWQHFLAELRDAQPVDPCPVDDATALAAWRDRFPARLAALLGPQPEPVPLNAEVIEHTDAGSYTREEVVYDTERHMSVPATLLVPHERTEPGPAVLAIHGHGPGRTQICDPGGGDGAYAHHLAHHGFVVLAFDLRTFGARADLTPPDRYGCDLTLTHQTMLGRQLLTLDLWDAARGLDLLAAHPLVDGDRLGAAGLSFGGTMTLFLAAMDARVKAAVVSGFFGSWDASARIPWNMCGSQVLAGMLGQLEHVDLGAAVAPRALLVESGTEDPIFPCPVAVLEHARLAKVYAALGAADRLALDVFEGGHRWNGRRAYDFLSAQL